MKKTKKATGYAKKGTDLIKRSMIAPCGMNCALCIGYLREKNTCPGCVPGADMPHYCKACIIRNCDKREKAKSPYCFDCDAYPCARLKRLDKRYRTRYGMSMTDNLENIRRSGIRKFVRNEKERWACRQCGGILSVHRKQCLFCGLEKRAGRLSVSAAEEAG